VNRGTSCSSIHPSAWKTNSRKFISKILHNHVPIPLELPSLDTPHSPAPLEAVMNSIRNGLGMREMSIAREPSRPWNPHFYAIFAQVHNTL
jgi:hypothetical protein